MMEKHIDGLISGLRYPVVFVKGFDKDSVIGKWIPANGLNRYSSIEIRNDLDEHTKLATLLHEIGHSRCDDAGCRCVKVISEEGERHAYMYTLQWLLKHKCRETLKVEMQYIRSLKKRSDYYGEAVKYVMALALWKDCKRYVNRLSWLQQLLKFKYGDK